MPRLGSSKDHHGRKSQRSKSPTHSSDSSRSRSPARGDTHRAFKPSQSNVEDLKRLLLVEKRLSELNSAAKELRKDKASLQQTVLTFMKHNRVGDIALNGGYSIVRKESKRKAPMRMEDLEKGLVRRFRISKEEAHEIIAQIKESMDTNSREVLQLKKPPKTKSKK